MFKDPLAKYKNQLKQELAAAVARKEDLEKEQKNSKNIGKPNLPEDMASFLSDDLRAKQQKIQASFQQMGQRLSKGYDRLVPGAEKSIADLEKEIKDCEKIGKSPFKRLTFDIMAVALRKKM